MTASLPVAMALRFIERTSGVTVRALLDLLGQEEQKRNGVDPREVEASARLLSALTGFPVELLRVDLARRRAAQVVLRRLPQGQVISGPLSDGQDVRLLVEAGCLYLLCPSCGRRRTALYDGPDRRLACRMCLGLRYRSQHRRRRRHRRSLL
jgi:hypothetical protein